MADYTATWAVHKTLTEDVIDGITLANTGSGIGDGPPGVTVVNRTGGAEIFGTWASAGAAPSDPTVDGDDTFILPAAVGAIFLPASTGPVIVKLISASGEEYSVEAI